MATKKKTSTKKTTRKPRVRFSAKTSSDRMSDAVAGEYESRKQLQDTVTQTVIPQILGLAERQVTGAENLAKAVSALAESIGQLAATLQNVTIDSGADA